MSSEGVFHPVNSDRDLDRELERRINSFLAARNVPALRRLSVESRQGVVSVAGYVQTFYERQLAAHVVRRVAGVVRLVDQIEVDPAAAFSDSFRASHAARHGVSVVSAAARIAAAAGLDPISQSEGLGGPASFLHSSHVS